MKSTFLFPKILFAGLLLVCFSTFPISCQTPEKKVVKQIVQYTCLMHPEVVSDKPGDCPKCGMKLVLKKVEVKETVQLNSTIPAELSTIFTNSCMKCHGPGGGSFALSMVDFSNWEQYTAVVKAKKAKAIAEVVTNGSMPPQSFQKANPGVVLLKNQIELIRTWSEALSAKK